MCLEGIVEEVGRYTDDASWVDVGTREKAMVELDSAETAAEDGMD